MDGLAIRRKYDLSFPKRVVLCMFWPSARERQKDVKILRSEQQ